jgi:hypothetical protein
MVAWSQTKPEKKTPPEVFNKIRKQVIDMVLMNQRPQAVAFIDNEVKQVDGDTKIKLFNLKQNTLSEFLSLASQDAYETAAAISLNEKKKSLKYIQECLQLEPDNLQCQWLELKYFKKYSDSQFTEKATKYLETIDQASAMSLVKISLQNSLKAMDGNALVPPPVAVKNLSFEDVALTHILNFQYFAKNKDYEKAKSSVQALNAIALDYPDLIFMKYQLGFLAPDFKEDNEAVLDRQNEVYRKKCADLSPAIVRKYVFDLELCGRSLN